MKLCIADDPCDRVRRSKFHRLVDSRSSACKSAAEDAGKREHVVDLVRIVRSARRDYSYVRSGILRHDFRNRVRHREYDRLLSHVLHVFYINNAGNGQSEKDIGAFNHVMNSALLVIWVGVLRVPVFYPIHVLSTTSIKGPRLIAADNTFDAGSHDDLGTRDAGRAHTV